MLQDTEKNLYGDEDAPKNPQTPTSFEIKEGQHTWEQVVKDHIEVKSTPSLIDTLQSKKVNTGKFKKIVLWVSIIAILGGGVAAGIVNYFSTRALSVEVQLPERVSAGRSFDVNFVYTNGTRTILTDARISVEVPDGVFFADDPGRTKLQLSKSMGDLGVGSSGDVAFPVTALGELGSVKEFKLVFSYKLNGLRSRFEKELHKQTAIGDPALQIDLVLPNKVQSGEQFNFEIHYTNTLDISLDDAWVRMESPLGFSVTLSRPELTALNFWKLGEVRPHESGVIFISGSGTGQGRDVLKFSVTGGTTLKNHDVVIARKDAQTIVAETPFALAITTGNDGAPVKLGDLLRYKIMYKNASGGALNDVIIKAKLIGGMFQTTDISGEGFFDPRDNTITWTAAQVPALKILVANTEGYLTFGVPIVREYPIQSLGDKNFIVRVTAEIDSLSIPAYLQSQKSLGKASHEIKVSGMVQIDTLAFFRDAKSGILNKGPFPPRVNEPTNYTIHWRVKNYGVDVSSVEVRSTLSPNATFTGKIVGNYGPNAPQYNERTQEIIWNIPRLEANSGVVSPSYEAIFQITMTPTVFNKGSVAKLIDRTIIKARDDFTGVDLSNIDQELTTLLPDDTTVGQRDGLVQ